MRRLGWGNCHKEKATSPPSFHPTRSKVNLMRRVNRGGEREMAACECAKPYRTTSELRSERRLVMAVGATRPSRSPGPCKRMNVSSSMDSNAQGLAYKCNASLSQPGLEAHCTRQRPRRLDQKLDSQSKGTNILPASKKMRMCRWDHSR